MASKSRRGARRRAPRAPAEAEPEGEELTLTETPRRKALTESERQDDFEDGRTQGGLYSRDEEDLAARGDEGSRRRDVRAGPLAVEAGEPETAAPASPKPEFRRPPSVGAPYVPDRKSVV